jgi:predicted ATP-binding protein involved in virulence
MHIKELRLEGFKTFNDRTFHFSEQFTVVVGNNASGKTSVLDGLAVAAGSFLLEFYPGASRGIYVSEIRSILESGKRITAPLAVVSAKGDFSKIAEEEEISWKRVLKPKADKSKSKTRRAEAKSISSLGYELFADKQLGGDPIFPIIAYHGTGRLFAEHKEKRGVVSYTKKEDGVFHGYEDCLSPKSSGKAFLSWFKTLEDECAKFQRTEDCLALELCKKKILEFVPEWEDVHFSNSYDDLIGIYTRQDGQRAELALSQLSDGYKNSIGLIGDIIRRAIHLNAHLGIDAVDKTPGIVLIDEIDLHLHPKWQKRIVKQVTSLFPEMQFVVTTHSPFIIQSLERKSQLIVLDEGILVEEEPFRKSIEEISINEMGIEIVRSKKFERMQKLAAEYFNLVESGVTSKERDELGQQLDLIEAEFSHDPAYAALLKFKREAGGL